MVFHWYIVFDLFSLRVSGLEMIIGSNLWFHERFQRAFI